MFRLFSAISGAVEVVQAGFNRLKERFQAALRRAVAGKDRIRCPPLQADLMDDLRDRVLVITAKAQDAPADPDAVACPSVFPMVALPIQECPAGVFQGRGSQSARALFHDPFQPLSPMKVFGISSNAFSPPLDGHTATVSSPVEMQSPISTNGSDSQSTPIFDVLNSPTEASTAPTTPASDIIELGSCGAGVAVDESSPLELKADCSNDDVPLSALLIQGVCRKTAKRNGISGDLLSRRKDVPLWVPELPEPDLKDSNSLPASEDGTDVWEHVDISNGKEGQPQEDLPGEVNLNAPDSPSVSQVYETPKGSHQTPPPTRNKYVNPTSWCDGWLQSDFSPATTEASVYSLDSYVPSSGTPRHSRISSRSIPCITLTPPSRPASPRIPPSITEEPSFEIVIDEDEFNARQASAFDTSFGDTSDIFKADSLLVPSSMPLPRSYDDEEDESLLKKQRRNACRLDTSSIDIIMAGLDQDFPDTPIASPMLQPADLSHDIIDLQDDNVSYETVGPASPVLSLANAPSSPATTVRHSVADLSGETLFIEDELESKFSDSSDEEDGHISKLTTNMLMRHSRLSWPVSPTPFGPGSVLDTIVEESEDDHSREFTKVDSPVSVLRPSAVITATARTVYPSVPRGKRRWFSMIEGSSGSGKSADKAYRSSQVKRMSAPASFYSNPKARLSHRSLSLNGSSSSRSRPPVYAAAFRRNPSTDDRPKPLPRPLILPQQVAMRGMVAENGYGSDGQESGSSAGGMVASSSFNSDGSEFSLTSSRSSSCIALYQRPWSIYVPREEERPRPLSVNSSNASGYYDAIYSTPGASYVGSAAHGALAVSDPESFRDSATTGHDDQGEMASVDLGYDIPLFLDTPSLEVQGLDGILAILDTMEFPTTSTSAYRHRNSSEVTLGTISLDGGHGGGWVVEEADAGVDNEGHFCVGDDGRGEVEEHGEVTVAEGGEEGFMPVEVCEEEGAEDACDVGTVRPWSNSEFVSYYDGSEAPLEGWPGVAA